VYHTDALGGRYLVGTCRTLAEVGFKAYNGQRKVVLTMDATVISTQILPLPIRERIHAPRVSITEQDGGVVLLLVTEQKKRPTKLFGMLAGSGMSSDEFSLQKQFEKGIK
jgi:hypothetical protein